MKGPPLVKTNLNRSIETLNYSEGSPSENHDIKESRYLEKTKHLSELLLVGCLKFPVELFYSYARPSRFNKSTTSQRQGSKTAWLDGLRGVASLMVLIHHSSWLWFPGLSRGYGSCSHCFHFVQLPFIRVFYMGSAMVAIFFVISGFSLSHKALGLIRSAQYPELLDSLSSSTFRRGMRLILPPAFLTFFMMLAAYFGLYATGKRNRQPMVYETFWENFANWFRSILDILDIFRPVFYPGVSYAVYIPPYDPNLWTIDVEFNASLIVFLILLGIAKLLPLYRLLILIAINLWLLYFVHSYLFLFMSGVLIAELHHIREDRVASNIQTLEVRRAVEDYSASAKSGSFQRTLLSILPIFWFLNFLLALFLLSMPLIDQGAGKSPGYMTLVSWIPRQYREPYIEDQFWIYLGAVNLIFTIDNTKYLQSIFTTRLAQYLGKIGFALYLVHGTFLYTMGYNLTLRMHAWTAKYTGENYTLAVFLTVLCVYPALFLTAHFVWRHVDRRSVLFAKWLYKKISSPKS